MDGLPASEVIRDARYDAERALESAVEAYIARHGPTSMRVDDALFEAVSSEIASAREAGCSADAVQSVLEDTVGFHNERIGLDETDRKLFGDDES